MDEKKKEKWYFKSSTLILAFLCVGPLMLPLVWANPGLNRRSKVIISAAVIILTVVVTVALVRSIYSLGAYYDAILNENI